MSENKHRQKKMIKLFMLSGLLVGLLIGVVAGIELYQVVSNRIGYWKGTIDNTKIIILSLRHQIQSNSRIRTTIELGNVDDHHISCNCTLYYKNTADQDLATYSFNASINAGQTYSRTFTVQPVNITQWIGTDTSIFEY